MVRTKSYCIEYRMNIVDIMNKNISIAIIIIIADKLKLP